MNYCFNCGKKVNEVQDVCLNCGVNLRKNKKIDNVNGKSKITAGILGIFLGCYGVHNFYLGYNGKAIAQLLITLLSLFLLSWVSAIWGLIEGILILTGNIKKDASGNDLID
ncbi:MAG TPA: TM2 domain-containing protein [Bacilli bacterium]|nr:tM2 domain containing protein [Mycoplasma sp. CAG:611]HJJ08275.1 TM2 domain-containing protein [Bacilli bacterium]